MIKPKIIHKISEKKNILLGIFSLIIMLGLWFIVAWITSEVRSVDFPSPVSTFKSLFKDLSGGEIYDFTIYQHTLTSLLRWATGFILAVITGVLAGLFIGLYPTLNKLFMPLVYVLQLVPGLAWIPIALLLFGLGNVSTIFMIYMLALTPIIITTSTGISNTPSDLIDSAILMGASRRSLFIHVLFPSALFHIVDGMRIGLANSWRVLIAAEMIVGNGVGLGYIIIQSRWSLNYVSAFVSIMIILIIGLTFEKFLFQVIDKRLRLKYGSYLRYQTISNE